MINFDSVEKGLGLVFPPHFPHFLKKVIWMMACFDMDDGDCYSTDLLQKKLNSKNAATWQLKKFHTNDKIL